MRIVGDGSPAALEAGEAALTAAWEAGYNHFDHADIYGAGRCESLFGQWLKQHPGARESMLLTTKCGIRPVTTGPDGAPQRYDFSKEYILKQVDGSLQRMGVEQVEVLLLHRPDFLFHPDEVAEAFAQLKSSGKVQYFGVSNFSPSQVSLLQSRLPDPLVCNQLEINLHNVYTLYQGHLDQCLQLGISPVAWSPMAVVAYSAWLNTFSDADTARVLSEVDQQAQRYGCDPTTIVLAWLLKLPSKVLPIIGSKQPGRIKAALEALELNYTREDWYRLLEARNGKAVL
jgi:predicted oxidoreductase